MHVASFPCTSPSHTHYCPFPFAKSNTAYPTAPETVRTLRNFPLSTFASLGPFMYGGNQINRMDGQSGPVVVQPLIQPRYRHVNVLAVLLCPSRRFFPAFQRRHDSRRLRIQPVFFPPDPTRPSPGLAFVPRPCRPPSGKLRGRYFGCRWRFLFRGFGSLFFLGVQITGGRAVFRFGNSTRIVFNSLLFSSLLW